jgi:hypothetical protein
VCCAACSCSCCCSMTPSQAAARAWTCRVGSLLPPLPWTCTQEHEPLQPLTGHMRCCGLH